MALIIEKKNGILEITGDLIGQNAKFLRTHFERLIENKEKITVGIDNVNAIDPYTVNVFSNLYEKAKLLNKSFHISVKKNKAIKKVFGKAKYLFENNN